jgi:menaquinone-9 beta-reductase
MTKKYDIVVTGGGPGGSACAATLGKKGYNVLLVDKVKFPRDKTCGDAISGSLRVQKGLGLIEKLKDSPHAEIHGIEFSSPDGVILDIPFENTGYCCRRYVYDNLVFEEAKKHADIIQEFEVTEVLKQGNAVVGIKGKHADGREEEIHAKIVIGADGAYSVVAQQTGCHDMDERHTLTAVRAYYTGVKDVDKMIELHFVDEILPGYFWIFPLENGTCNVGVGMVDKFMKKKKINMTKAMFDIIKDNPLFKERFANAKLEAGSVKGWRLPVGSKRRKMHGEGFMLVGDAAGLIDPFTGEGIANAMISGQIAAEWAAKALEKNDFSAEYLKGYGDAVWDDIGEKLKISYRLQRIGNIKFLTNMIIRKAARSSQIRTALKNMVDDVESRNNIINPMFYLKVLLA